MTSSEHPELRQIPPFGDTTIEEIANAHADTIAEIRNLDPMETAVTFSGLLTMPGLQSNCLRIETLIYLALAYCEGRAAPTTEFVLRSFERMGDGYCGMMEDPSEDVFVTLVNTPRGNFRIFEGIWEGAGFYLQRFLDIVETMPNREPFNHIRNSIESLLRLSDAVAARAGVQEYTVGQELPLDALPADLADRISVAGGAVQFSDDELAQLQISKAPLAEFVINADDRTRLRTQFVGHSDLERRPIAVRGEYLCLLLPTAVEPAIKRLVIEFVISTGQVKAFERALSTEYGQLFSEIRMLGKRLPAPIGFQRIDGGLIASMMTEADPGRFLHFVFFVDGLDNFSQDGLLGVNANPAALSAALRSNLGKASAKAREQRGFRDGISLLITCGFGRGLRVELTDDLPKDWRFEFIAAHDLVTLNWLSNFDALSLWRLLDSRRAIEALGPEFLNVNGLLNLVAWSRRLGGHLVPHARLPVEFANSEAKNLIVVPQNAIRDLRHSVATEWTPLRVLDPDGRWVRVRKLDRSEFEEDNLAPLYGSEEDVHAGKLRAVYVTPRRSWWIEIAAPEHSPSGPVYEHWMMLCIWVKRAAPILEREYSKLPPIPISVCVRFAEILGTTNDSATPADMNKLRRLFQVCAEVGSPSIQINIREGFDDGFFQPENLAERALVEALVAGAAKASNESLDVKKQTKLVDEICPNSEARCMHRFQARFFRDYVQSELHSPPVLIDQLDEAASRIGLGWKARSRDSGSEIAGVSECRSYLNDVVSILLDELCNALHSLDRHSFARAVLHNYETAAYDRDVWGRTSQAVLAMHSDQESAVRTIVVHVSRLNACFISSRILLEAIICECPLTGGNTPGRLELSRAMALAMSVFYLGGWSDAVHWGAMEPTVRITPLGDVHMKQDFMDNVYLPFGRVIGEEGVRRAADSYSKIYEPVNVMPSVESVLDTEFLIAWEAEFGSSMDGLRAFLDKLEDIGRHPPKALLELPRSELTALLRTAAGTSAEGASATLSMLTLAPRPTWRAVAGEFSNKDWFPWRFRRRLSVLRRPFIQIDSAPDPTILFAPGLVREALLIGAQLFHDGGIPLSQVKSREMSKWIGHANNVQRTKFNLQVADRMRELGWQVDREVRLTKLLGRPLDRDYGDIDVLAWRRDSGRVLVIECKDLQFRKTPGEVAEQLADFRGEVRQDGKPDHLKRHLNRLAVLKAHEPKLARTLNLAAPTQMTGHLVFKNPVPMRFAWDKMASRIQLSLFDELDRL